MWDLPTLKRLNEAREEALKALRSRRGGKPHPGAEKASRGHGGGRDHRDRGTTG